MLVLGKVERCVHTVSSNSATWCDGPGGGLGASSAELREGPWPTRRGQRLLKP